MLTNIVDRISNMALTCDCGAVLSAGGGGGGGGAGIGRSLVSARAYTAI